MAKIAHLVDGKLVTIAQDFSVVNIPEATEENSGLMSAIDKGRLDNAYSVDDIADKQTIKNLFMKG